MLSINLFPMVFFAVNIMAISGIIKTKKIIAKIVILSKLQTALNTYNVWCMTSVQAYPYLLNHLNSILDNSTVVLQQE